MDFKNVFRVFEESEAVKIITHMIIKRKRNFYGSNNS